jgi:hypothetical protein
VRKLLVTFDLVSPDYDYEPFFRKIKTFDNNATRALFSVWIVSTDVTAREVFTTLRDLVHRKDRLMVFENQRNWFAKRMNDAAIAKLEGQLLEA